MSASTKTTKKQNKTDPINKFDTDNDNNMKIKIDSLKIDKKTDSKKTESKKTDTKKTDSKKANSKKLNEVEVKEHTNDENDENEENENNDDNDNIVEIDDESEGEHNDEDNNKSKIDDSTKKNKETKKTRESKETKETKKKTTKETKKRFKKPDVDIKVGKYTKLLDSNPNTLVPLGKVILDITQEIAKVYGEGSESENTAQNNYIKCVSEFSKEDLQEMIRLRSSTERKKQNNVGNVFVAYELDKKGKKIPIKKPKNAMSIFNDRYKNNFREILLSQGKIYKGNELVIAINKMRCEQWTKHRDEETKEFKECVEEAKRLKQEYINKYNKMKVEALESGEFNPKPKKPKTAYLIFTLTDENRNKFKDLSIGDRAKSTGLLWEKMTEEEKAKYYKLAELEKFKHEKNLKIWEEKNNNKTEEESI